MSRKLLFYTFFMLPLVLQGQASSIRLAYDIKGFGTFYDRGILHYHEGESVFFVQDTFSAAYKELYKQTAIAKERDLDEKLNSLPKNSVEGMIALSSPLSKGPELPQEKEFPSGFVQTDLNNGIRLSRKYYLDNTYVLREKTGSIRWRFKSEEKVILGFHCQKAIGKFGGRTYTVWYTTEVPMSIGPWKLDGLPGVMVQGMEDYGRVSFKLVNIQYNLPRPDIPTLDPKPNEIISCQENFKLQKREQEVIKKRIMALSTENITMGAPTIIIDPIQKKCN
ncbi:MAG: GLPGLI family protein [Flavobacteriaceae bacterium]|nr:GLPGLI family protein [Flavobacteriaceae bacterium]MCY4267436.1 GLPGLI family protein [Flavobacteriaceae bacterium]MCY4299120.1 GLPGLI family protein [Flavobacteriaceae bacterium]